MKTDELKKLCSAVCGEGVFESWGAEPDEQTDDKILSFAVNGLILHGRVVITDTDKDKYYNVAFVDDNGQTISTHTSSKNNLPKLIDAKVERAKEWSDDEYRAKYLERAKQENLSDLYTAMEAVRAGDLEQMVIFNEHGEPLECKKDGKYITLRNMTTNEILLKQSI
jgi:hypothetical protein